MRIIPRRAGTERESPFHTPEQLALAMPLAAMIGLMVVVSAVATGGSRPVVALVAVGGFGLCALAPLALIDVFVTRPLRGALTQIRAARDGRTSEAAFASGVVADLVHLARDLHAARAVLGDSTGNLAEPFARAQIVELAAAVKALRAAPACGLDGAVERLEAMLVYIAESLDRIEAKGGVGQVEQRIADLTRLVARDTEIVQGAIASGDFSLRADVAGAAAEEQLGRARLQERIDALETRLFAKLAMPDPNEAHLDGIERRVIDGMAALVKVAEQIGQAADRLDVQAVAGAVERLSTWAAQRLDAFETRALAPACGALAGAARDFVAAQARLGELALRVDTAAQRFEAAQTRRADAAAPPDIQAQLSRFAQSLRAQSDDLVSRIDAAALAPARAALAEAAQRFETAQTRLGDVAARVEAGDPRLPEAVQKLAALAETDARDGQALRADFAANAAASAEKFDAAARDLARSVEDRVERLRRGELWPAIAAAQATAQDLHKAHAGLFAHVEALKAALMTDRSGFAALRLDVVEAVAAVAAIGERVEYAARALEDRRGDRDPPAIAAESLARMAVASAVGGRF